MKSTSRNIFTRMSGMHGMADVSLKQLVSWGEHLKADQPQLDAQHEGIFALAMEIADAWHKHSDLGHLKTLAAKLSTVLQGHFRYEEQQLEAVGYPDLARHRAEHEMMLDELNVIRDRLARMGHGKAQMAPGFIVYNFILGITVGHIGNSDMEYCAYARRTANSREQVWPTS